MQWLWRLEEAVFCAYVDTWVVRSKGKTGGGNNILMRKKNRYILKISVSFKNLKTHSICGFS